MSRISSIGKEDVHRITSGQVIVDLSTAVKELVENSLDANAKKVEVIFKSYGIDSIEVSDDGDGIDESDFDKLALKHFTSKLSTFEDVAKVKTLGFRGEAMSSLCAISNVKVTTTKKAPKATTIEYSQSGEMASTSICSRPRGTTVSITDLFNNLPVRRKDFMKNSKKEFSKCLTLLQSYALISLNTKILVYNMTPKGKKNMVLSSQGNPSMKNNIINVFGSNGMYGLVPIEFKLDLNQHKSRLKVLDHSADYTISITGFISKCSFGFGRSATDRQLFFINNRPVSLQPFAKAINEVYKSFNHLQYPVIILNLDLDPQFLDVNVTPDKRTVLIHNENHVLEKLRETLTEYYDSQDLSLSKNTQTQGSLEIRSSSLSTKDEEDEKPIQSSLSSLGFAYGQKEPQKNNIFVEEEEEEEDDQEKDDYELEPDTKKRRISEVSDLPKRRKNDEPEDLTPDHESGDEDVPEEEESEYEEPVTIRDDKDDVENEPLINEPFIEAKSEPRPSIRESLATLRSRFSSQTTSTSNPKDLSSFRREESKTPEPKQVTLEPLLMKIGDKEIVEKAYINKKGGLAFEDCHCGGSHSDTSHKSDVEDVIEDEEDHVVEDINDEEIKDEENRYESPLESPSQLEGIKNDEGISQELVDNELAEETDDSELPDESFNTSVRSMKSEFNNKYFSTAEREKDASKNYELGLSFKVSDRDIRINSGREGKNKQEELKNLAIDNIADQEESENKLTLSVSKKDFKEMKIIGQFNLGFIIVIRQNGDTQDLFIVDQHASDEKYNFETLQKVTMFDSQPLVVPKFIELNALDELTVLDNKDVFIRNGFKFELDEEGEPGSRVKLVSLPLSKKTIFGEDDFNELIHLVKENSGNTGSVRCSKIRSMFAMRACRKSIMVGRSLNMKTMTKVVRNLGELDKPWNCPHGRPTMRHLMELEQWEAFEEDYRL